MAANKLQWRRIAKGDKLPCQSFLRKKNGEILKLSTGAGVTVGQDAYYLPVDDVINVIKDYPVEESEDGKIRKALVEMVHDTVGDSLWVDYGVHKEDAIAWLEIQGEHANFLNNIQIGDKVTRNRDGMLVNLSQLNRVAKKDEKQVEQKPVPDWMPTFLDELRSKKNYFDWDEHKDIEGGILAIINWMNPNYFNEKDGKQKPTDWPEKYIADVFEMVGLAKIVREQGNDALTEALQSAMIELAKYSVVPQPKQEWSEEDDSKLKEVLYYIEYVNKTNVTFQQRDLAHLINWLKPLKERVGCEANCTTTWKPSEEQMVVLAKASETYCGIDKGVLYSLYNDLKKLRD